LGPRKGKREKPARMTAYFLSTTQSAPILEGKEREGRRGEKEKRGGERRKEKSGFAGFFLRSHYPADPGGKKGGRKFHQGLKEKKGEGARVFESEEGKGSRLRMEREKEGEGT